MTTGVACPTPILQFFDNNGNPCVGGTVLTQVGGVNYPTYQDAAGTTALPNPIPLNSRGEISNAAGTSCQVFLVPNIVYTFTLYDQDGNLLNQANYVSHSVLTGTDIAALLSPLIAVPILNSDVQTAAEVAAGVTPTNYSYPPGNALRYGVDPTGTNDSTAAIQNWIDATWAMYQYLDSQGLWNGGGGAVPVMQLPPGKFKVSGTMYLPSGCTLKGAGHPAHTVSHTRLVMNSTGVTPPNMWAPSTVYYAGDMLQPSTPNGYWYYCTAGGTSGASPPTWPTSGSVTDGTVTWACEGAVSAGDNRNSQMFKFRRGTLPSGGSLQDSVAVSTIQELEFWFVGVGGTFANPIGTVGFSQRSYPTGAIFAFDVDVDDMRFVDCVFQASPCSLWMQNISTTTATRGDGFTGNRGICFFVENCEFDASASHVYASGCALDVFFKNCQFFASEQFFYNNTGKVIYQACYLQQGEALDFGVGTGGGASPAANSMTSLSMMSCEIEPEGTVLNTSGVNLVNFVGNTLDVAATTGGIYIKNAVGGSITGNVFDSQGANAPAGSSFSSYVAAIKLDGCQNMLVSGNNITASYTAIDGYNGFGILTGTSTAQASQYNFVSGNAVTAPYNGALVSGQDRCINLASADIKGVNFILHNSATTPVWPIAQTTGFGTPTGGAVVNNFPGATATLVQTSETLAEVLSILKSMGIIGT